MKCMDENTVIVQDTLHVSYALQQISHGLSDVQIPGKTFVGGKIIIMFRTLLGRVEITYFSDRTCVKQSSQHGDFAENKLLQFS